MSASKEKRKRQQLRSDGIGPREKQLLEQEAKKKRDRIIYWVVGIVAVLLIAAVFTLNSNLFYNKLPAVEIGELSYTAAEYNYYYYSAYNSFCNNNSDYLYLYFDTDQPLDEQEYPYGEDMTWADYFRETALENMRTISVLYTEAQREGMTITEENSLALDETIAYYEAVAAMYGTGVDQYFASIYGKGCTAKLMREIMARAYIADQYYNQIYDGFAYTGEELEAYYQEHSAEYDSVTYAYRYFSAAADEETGVTLEDAMAEAKANAEAMAEAADLDEFNAICTDITGSDAYEYTYTIEKIPSSYSEWLSDSARKSGDVTTIEVEESGWYALYFIDRTDNHYNTRSARHILVTVTANSEGVYTDAILEQGQISAELILDEWLAGEATEESFAALAEENSEDSGSYNNGGLYENIYRGQMVSEFEDFVFDESRKSGDTGIIYVESTNYAGYHIIYYVGEGQLYSDYLADLAMRYADYTAWLEAAGEGFDITTRFSFRFAD